MIKVVERFVYRSGNQMKLGWEPVRNEIFSLYGTKFNLGCTKSHTGIRKLREKENCDCHAALI